MISLSSYGNFSPLISYSLDYEIKRCLEKNEKIIKGWKKLGYELKSV